MKLTTRGRYAVTALLDLALRYDQGAVSLSDVSGRQGISQTYLEQLFAKLRRSGLVDSTRGPGGGYSLTTPPCRISLAQIIDAIDENIDATLCGGSKNCFADHVCLTHVLWEELSAEIRLFLSTKTLGDLVDQPHVKTVAKRQEHTVQFVQTL